MLALADKLPGAEHFYVHEAACPCGCGFGRHAEAIPSAVKVVATASITVCNSAVLCQEANCNATQPTATPKATNP